MSWTRRFLISSCLLTVLLGVFINREEAPVGISQPLKLKVMLSVNRLLQNTASLLESLGVCDRVTCMRHVIDRSVGFLTRPVEGVWSENTLIDGVPVRTYRDQDIQQTQGPAVVYFHGGGFILGNLDTHHAVAGFLCRESKALVVSVDYRLNPEYSKEDGREDCLRVTKFLIQNAAKYGVDPSRVAVVGDSAGGNYAAGVALVLRDQGFSPMPKIQMLIYPSVQTIDLELPSYQQNINGIILDRDYMALVRSVCLSKSLDLIPDLKANTHVTGEIRKAMSEDILNVDKLPKELLYHPYEPPVYKPGNETVWNTIRNRILDKYNNPLMAESLSGLPETYIFTAMHDQLRDEGFLYAARLQEHGVKVTHYNCPYGFHGMVNAWPTLQDSRKVMDRLASFLIDNL